MAEQQQEITMEGMVIQDLSQQIAQISVDRSAWSARAKIAEHLLEEAQERIVELEKEDTDDSEEGDK